MQVLNRKEHKAMADSSAHSESGDSDVSFGSSGAFGRHPGAGAANSKGLFAGMLYPHGQSLPYGCQMGQLYNNNGYGESDSKMPRLDLSVASNGNGGGNANGGSCSPTAATPGRTPMSPTSYLAAANNFAQLQSMSMNAAAAVALQNAATAAFLAQQHQQQPSTTGSSTAVSMAAPAAVAPPTFCAPLPSAKTNDMLPLMGGGPSGVSVAGGSLSPIADGFYRNVTSLSPQSLAHLPNRASAESTLSTRLFCHCQTGSFVCL